MCVRASARLTRVHRQHFELMSYNLSETSRARPCDGDNKSLNGNFDEQVQDEVTASNCYLRL